MHTALNEEYLLLNTILVLRFFVLVWFLTHFWKQSVTSITIPGFDSSTSLCACTLYVTLLRSLRMMLSDTTLELM